MEEEALSPISIEVISADSLSNISILAKVEEDSNCKSGISRTADAVLGLASNVIDIAEGANLYRVEVPSGYSLNDLVASKKNPEAVRALVKDPKGHLSGDVSLKAAGISPAQIASVGLAAAAMVVGQAYMTEINDKLQNIDTKLDTIVAMIAGEQKAKIKNALDIARAYSSLYDEYQAKPLEARQAARNEIEGRYNDIGQVIDWITEQLSDVQKRAVEAKTKEKDIAPLLEELHSYEEQFSMCLQALSALAMTRMYYDGTTDERSAVIEQQRIREKSREFVSKRRTLAGIIEMKIGDLKNQPISLPQNAEKNPVKRLISQSPRAAAKEQLLQTKTQMQSNLRTAQSKIENDASACEESIKSAALASQSSRVLLTDGTSCWLIGNDEQSEAEKAEG